MFELEALPGVEAFESAIVALDSYPDTNPGMEDIQAKARSIAFAIKDQGERTRIDGVIKTKAFRDFAAASPNIGHGTVRNNWARPACCGHFGKDWLTRTLVNLAGIWANTFDEVIYYKGNLDSTGTQINANNSYSLTFPVDMCWRREVGWRGRSGARARGVDCLRPSFRPTKTVRVCFPVLTNQLLRYNRTANL